MGVDRNTALLRTRATPTRDWRVVSGQAETEPARAGHRPTRNAAPLNWNLLFLEAFMPAEIILQQTPDAVALLEKREQLAELRTMLAERESELGQRRVQLKAFESRYLRQVAILYAELDDLEARIAERECALDDSSSARRRAEQARQRAQQTHDAAFDETQTGDAEEFDPPASLKTLFREVAKRIHPDFARDDAEQKYFTLLMARANHAYSRGDAQTLQRLLDDYREIDVSVAGEGAAAELLRIARQIRHAERDLAALDFERQALLSSEIAQLHLDAEAAAGQHRDLLAELATSLCEQIAETQRRFDLLDLHTDLQTDLHADSPDAQRSNE
jgi:hypothetical protein